MATNTRKITKNGNGKAKQSNAQERAKTRPEAEDRRAYQEAEVTAAAWGAATRVKVLELSHEAGVLDCIGGRPDKEADYLMLRCVLSSDGVGRFIRAAYELEESLDELLSGDAEPTIPDLAGALRRAGETCIAIGREATS